MSCFPQSLWLKFHSRIQAVDKPTIKPSERPTDSRNLMQRPRALPRVLFFCADETEGMEPLNREIRNDRYIYFEFL